MNAEEIDQQQLKRAYLAKKGIKIPSIPRPSLATVSGLFFGRRGQAVYETAPLALYADCAVI